MQLKPPAWWSFFERLPSFYISLFLSLFVRLFSPSLPPPLFLFLFFFSPLSTVFRNSALADDNGRELVDRLCRARVCVGVMIFELPSCQKPSPLAACAFVPSTRTRDRHLAFNGDDRRFPLSPSGPVYLISNAGRKATCLGHLTAFYI